MSRVAENSTYSQKVCHILCPLAKAYGGISTVVSSPGIAMQGYMQPRG